MAQMAAEAGCAGVVASAQELAPVREAVGDDVLIVTPVQQEGAEAIVKKAKAEGVPLVIAQKLSPASQSIVNLAQRLVKELPPRQKAMEKEMISFIESAEEFK
jgi:orotidine-5'-phosphate decarboxylase